MSSMKFCQEFQWGKCSVKLLFILEVITEGLNQVKSLVKIFEKVKGVSHSPFPIFP